ncbi:MAG: GDSL-type esterase/lipase family protein [Pseudomonadota bacterium]
MLLCLLGFLAACGAPESSRERLPDEAVVLAFGDSITFGTGAATSAAYPLQLAELTGWRVVNAGVPGDTAGEAVSRLPAALEQYSPALLILELGGNDFLRQRQALKVKEDLRAMIREARAAGVEVVLVAVPRLSLARGALGLLEDAALYADLAEEEGVALFSSELSAILSDSSLRADRIHPNAAGYRQFAEALSRFLAEVGYR